ncbi:MAG TPA: FAD-binding oxidoreductase [Candidatus Deferrimicrobium sp.]|nr:FAD-binding oxidoreductase [Candidatus Deferrimicrobium sp.]
MTSDMKFVVESLQNILGSDYVATDKEICYVYSRDCSIEKGFIPDVVIRPKTTEEVSKIMKLANEQKVSIYPRGAAASLVLMGVPLKPNSIVMDLTRMNKIVELDEDSMSVTVETGITWGELEFALKEKGWYTGFIGPGPGLSSTIGGAISVCSVYYGSAKYGTAADITLGLEVVLPTGEIIRTGSAALQKGKRHTRYGIGFDASGLFCGDQGILGVKTQATLKLFPLPKVFGFFTFGYTTLDACHDALYQMTQLHIASDIGYVDQQTVPLGPKKYRFLLHGKIESHNDEELNVQSALIKEIADNTGGSDLGPSLGKLLFGDMVYEYFPMAGAFGAYGASCNKVPIAKAKELHAKFISLQEKYKEELKKYNILAVWYTFISGSCIDILPQFQIPVDNPESREMGIKIWKELINEEVQEGVTHYWLGKVIGDRVAEHYQPEYYAFVKKIKSTLDPNGILNPGLLKLW